MESDKYICIRETGAQNQVVIVDMATPLAPQRRQITADSALMCPDKKVIALKATTPGTPGDALQVFNLDTKTKLKSHQMPESVEFWKWITPNMLGLVTATSVYHWDIQVGVLQAQSSTALQGLPSVTSRTAAGPAAGTNSNSSAGAATRQQGQPSALQLTTQLLLQCNANTSQLPPTVLVCSSAGHICCRERVSRGSKWHGCLYPWPAVAVFVDADV
jgi:hypothetical protein